MQTPGRRVWYRYRDDQIRDDEQYYAYLNYIHANPSGTASRRCFPERA